MTSSTTRHSAFIARGSQRWFRQHAQIVVHRPRQSCASHPDRRTSAAAIRELQAQYQTILRMAQSLGNMEGYRIADDRSHVARRRRAGTYGRPWLQGLNSGDATGAAYLAARRCR